MLECNEFTKCRLIISLLLFLGSKVFLCKGILTPCIPWLLRINLISCFISQYYIGCFLSFDQSSNSIFLPVYIIYLKKQYYYERYSELFFLSDHLLIRCHCVIVSRTGPLFIEEGNHAFFHVEPRGLVTRALVEGVQCVRLRDDHCLSIHTW